jgi:DNA invertase Pin-like site-specific DNA recombinase
MNAELKVTAEHLQRAAYLYIRQSTLHQVLENTESTERQYALRRRAVALGWSSEQIVVIDNDQAQSGASAADRAGFQRLVGDVGLGKAGIVMGLEVSRLARNCADWHRLLEICALTHTLILDEDGLYNPGQYNDRLLLGLKGTMSEAELHILKARMIGGMINKAQRGELKMPLPVGLAYDDDDRVELEPDQQVQQCLRVFFATFGRTGSAWKTMQAFNEQGLKFPRRRRNRLADPDPSPCHPDLAQSALRRRLLLRPKAAVDRHRRQDALQILAAGTVALREEGRPSRLPYLGRVCIQ